MEKINREAIDLAQTIINVNNWIRVNPNTDINAEEIFRLTTDFAILSRRANIAAINQVYPVNEEGKNGDHYTLVRDNKYLKLCYNGIEDMKELRKLDDNDFMVKTKANHLLWELLKDGYCGCYDIPENERLADCKRSSIINITKVNFYIFTELKRNRGFQFANINEYNQLMEAYTEYKSRGNGQYIDDISSQMKQVTKSYVLK